MGRMTFAKKGSVFRSRVSLAAHHTSFHAVLVWFSLHTVSRTALYTFMCLAVLDDKPAFADEQARFRKKPRSIFLQKIELQILSRN